MKGEDLKTQERKRLNFNFCSNLFQGGRSKPRKYKHSLKIPFPLYDDLCQEKVLDPEDLYIEEVAFFSFSMEFSKTDPSKVIEFVTISFISLYLAEDLHRKIDHYLIMQLQGFYPIERFGIFF